MLSVSAVSFISQTQISQPTFASMGSTGGGSSSGGSSSSGSSSFLPSSSDEDYSSTASWNGEFSWFDLLFVGIIAWAILVHGLLFRLHLLFKFKSGFLFKNFFSNNLFKVNQTFRDFQNNLMNNKLYVTKVQKQDKYHDYTEVYAKAQYLYSQVLRERYVDHHYSLKELRTYLDSRYYRAMKKEIKLKVRQGTVDETIVSNINVQAVCQLDDHLTVLKLSVTGQDKEVQFNKGFEDSFTRSKWSDYVIFGKTSQGDIKIINLIYGEHFHLNGQDFNHEKNQGGSSYEEKHID